MTGKISQPAPCVNTFYLICLPPILAPFALCTKVNPVDSDPQPLKIMGWERGDVSLIPLPYLTILRDTICYHGRKTPSFSRIVVSPDPKSASRSVSHFHLLLFHGVIILFFLYLFLSPYWNPTPTRDDLVNLYANIVVVETQHLSMSKLGSTPQGLPRSLEEGNELVG